MSQSTHAGPGAGASTGAGAGAGPGTRLVDPAASTAVRDGLVVRASTAEATAALRRAVLRPHFTVDQMAVAGDQHPDTAYLAIADPADHSRVLGCVRLQPVPCPWPQALDGAASASWQLRSMATDPSVRGVGLGRLLVTAAVEHVAAQGGDLIWCNARVSAEGFYSRQGFRTVTDTFVVHDVCEDHVGMVRNGADRSGRDGYGAGR